MAPRRPDRDACGGTRVAVTYLILRTTLLSDARRGRRVVLHGVDENETGRRLDQSVYDAFQDYDRSDIDLSPLQPACPSRSQRPRLRCAAAKIHFEFPA